jgi:nitrate/nitrite transporter NarK
VVAVLLADLYGTAHYGAINGMVAMAGAVAGSLGPVIVAAVRDATGDYTLVLVGLVGVAVLGLASINLAVRPQPPRASADGAG